MLTLAPTSGSTTFSGVIQNGSGTVGLTLTGAASGTTQVLAGANTYSGPTLVNNGTLRVTGSLGATAVSVGDGMSGHAATLSGSGTINGPVTINSAGGGAAGTITGASGSTLTLAGGLTLNDGAISNFALTAAGYDNSTALVATSGGPGGNSLVFAGGTDYVNLTGTAQPGTYDLYSFDGAMPAGSFMINSNTISTPNLNYAINVTSNQVDLMVNVITQTLTWNGATSTNWDTTSGDQNWANGSTAAAILRGAT